MGEWIKDDMEWVSKGEAYNGWIAFSLVYSISFGVDMECCIMMDVGKEDGGGSGRVKHSAGINGYFFFGIWNCSWCFNKNSKMTWDSL